MSQDLRRHYLYNGLGSFYGTFAMGAGRFTFRRNYLSRCYLYNGPRLFDGTVAMGAGIVHNALQERIFLESDSIENQSEKNK